MKKLKREGHSNNFLSIKMLTIIVSLAIPLIYVLGIASLSFSEGINFNEVILYKYSSGYSASATLVNYLIDPLTALSGLLLIMYFPGVLFAPIFIRNNRPDFSLTHFFCMGFIFNIFLLFLGTTFLKVFGIAISRFWLVVVMVIEILFGIFIFSISNTSFLNNKFSTYKNTFFYIVLLFFIIVFFIIFFRNDILYPPPANFDYKEESILKMEFSKIGDPQEEFGIAHYLKNRLLPYWLIESLHKFGVYIDDPHLSYFYNFFSIILLGESYVSLNLLSLIFILNIFLISHKIICLGKKKTKNMLLYIGPGFFMLGYLWLLLGSSRKTDISFTLWPENTLWDPINSLWVFLMMCTIFFLVEKDFVFTLLFSFLATFCRYETIPLIVILMVLYYYFFKEDRIFGRRFMKCYFIFLIFFLGYSIILCFHQGGGVTYLQQIITSKLLVRFDWLRKNLYFIISQAQNENWPYFNWLNTREFIKLSLLSTYFFVILFFVPSKDRITNFLCAFGAIFFILLTMQSHKLVSHGCLLIPLAAVGIRRFVYPSIKIKIYNLLIYFAAYSIAEYFLR